MQRTQQKTILKWWPSPQDYNEAIQNASVCFQDSELKSGSVCVDAFGLPRPITGGFASVYRVKGQSAECAVRCFLRYLPEAESRYGKVADFLRSRQLKYFVGFEYLHDGIRVNGQWFSILKMDWVEGETLDCLIKSKLESRFAVGQLADRFKIMCEDLQREGIAHGDLQHGNIMVRNDELVLVDYDGMYVPSLAGSESTEVGHRNYQHPGRTERHFGPYLDNFSAWVIYLSLKAISVDPSLYTNLRAGDDCLLFRSEDFLEPTKSCAFVALEGHHNEELRTMAKFLRSQLKVSPEMVPPLGAIPTSIPALEPLDPHVLPMRLVTNSALSGIPDWVNGPHGASAFHPEPIASAANKGINAPTGQSAGKSTAGPKKQAQPKQRVQPPRSGQPAMLLAAGFFLAWIWVNHGNWLWSHWTNSSTDQGATSQIESSANPSVGSDLWYDKQGLAYFELGDFNRAIEYFTKAIKVNSNNAQSYTYRARAYNNTDRPELALADANKAISLDPNYASAYVRRAYAYNNLGQPEKAIADCTKALSLNPKNADAYGNRSMAYMQQGKYDLAIKDCNQSIRLDPTAHKPYLERAIGYQNLGRYDDSIADLSTSIKLDPNDVAAFVTRGSTYIRMGKYQEAIEDCTHAISANSAASSTGIAYGNRGVAYLNLGQDDKAMQDFNDAIKVFPSFRSAYENRADLYDKRGQHALAAADRARAEKLPDRDAY